MSGPGQNRSASAAAAGGTLQRPAFERARMVDVHDQRVRRRPTLQLEYLADGIRILRVRAEPIDGFGRERDDLAFAQGLDGLVDLVLR